MLSALDLKNKKVEPKKRKYYDKEEMDDYLELVFSQYKELYDENQEMKKNVKSLNDGIQYYKSIESTMQKALVLAEKTAKETKDAAQLKAEAIEKDANTKAEKIVAEAEQNYDKLKEKCLYLVQQFNQYKMQLKQVASAQLELITSESFDVYSPELEAIQEEKTSLPENEYTQSESDPVSQPMENEDKEVILDSSTTEKEDTDLEIEVDQNAVSSKEELEKTTILPDIRKELSSSPKVHTEGETLDDILTADTIDLSSSIDQIKKASTKEVQDALVLEPIDAIVTEPLDLQPIEANEATQEVLEPEKGKNKESPTLDSLLQSINIGKKNKKKKGQDEDPFEFLGSVDDF